MFKPIVVIILLEIVGQNLIRSAVFNQTGSNTQPNIISTGKDHGLFLWITLKPVVDTKQIAKVLSGLQNIVDKIVPPRTKTDFDEVIAGIGFGPNFYKQVTGRKTKKSYVYQYRKGPLGDLPSSDGDIFIHAKSNSFGKLFELTQSISNLLPVNSTEKFEDIYSFVFRNGRDLSGFIDGTENPAVPESIYNVAVEKDTGGSYCITQKWIHNMKFISQEKDSNLEAIVGRFRTDSQELPTKPPTSHVARMTSGTQFQSVKPFQIYRQSMPFGYIGSSAGLFFIAFSSDPSSYEYMLDRMVGASSDGLSDDIMRLSRCDSGIFWYFPSVEELTQLA